MTRVERVLRTAVLLRASYLVVTSERRSQRPPVMLECSSRSPKIAHERTND